jgi:hypothetical protein
VVTAHAHVLVPVGWAARYLQATSAGTLTYIVLAGEVALAANDMPGFVFVLCSAVHVRPASLAEV